jgi:prepilin-type N-terminal cleavage/methylation domain-containing protein
MRRRARGFTLLEVVAALAIASLAAALVVARLPDAGALALERAARRVADRLSEARERAILGGHPVTVRITDGLPDDVRLDALHVGGTPIRSDELALAPDGDALPARVVLVGAGDARREVLLPAGFHGARVAEGP